MPGNTSHTFFDQLVEAIERSQREAEASQRARVQRASQIDIEKARKEVVREKMETEQKAEKERKEKAEAEKKKAEKAGTGVEKNESPLGEKLDARKMVIYSEIMNPKYRD